MALKPLATFVRKHPETGKTQERVAYSPAEAVKFRFDGWTEQTADKPADAGTATKATGASSPKP